LGATIVDRFLASRRAAAQAAPQPAKAASPPPAAPAPKPPEPAMVDFVCENDVREAIRLSKKIYIGPKTIVTPAARDLGDQHGVLIQAKR
jgi:pyruvate/2-oxoglutarate dehydrogenase complex dihydrolipoamide acyltransferase (E2) component